MSNDEYERLRAEVNCDWARSVKCIDCGHCRTEGTVTMYLLCLKHNKSVDPDQWCIDGVKK